MTTDRLQQARDAAADTAFPDEGYRWAGRTTPPPPLTPRRGQTFAPWREWTLEDSRHVIDTSPALKRRGVKRGSPAPASTAAQRSSGPRTSSASSNPNIAAATATPNHRRRNHEPRLDDPSSL